MSTAVYVSDVVTWLRGREWLTQNEYLPRYHAGTLTEEAHTAPYCYPAGDGWQRHGECTDRNGFTLWVWRRLWTMLLPTDKGNGRRT